MEKPEKIHLVCATWEYEGSLDLVAFNKLADAEKFVSECQAYQETEPDDDYHPEWEDSHPAAPYVADADTICGVESFIIIPVTVL